MCTLNCLIDLRPCNAMYQRPTRCVLPESSVDFVHLAQCTAGSSIILLHSYQSLLVSLGDDLSNGGLADGLADGLGLELRTRRLSVSVFVPLTFQPVGLNLNIALRDERK